jgi:myo-inositol 2-dehydrogenase/D-chiro-inositol 1-dehydrogenase
LQIGFQRRFDKAYARVSKMIENGELGRIEVVRDTMRDPNPPHESYIPTSGGLFRDMVIHDFDCVRWLMRSEPVEIFAMGGNLVDPVFAKYGDIDTCVVNIKFESGSLGAIDASRRSGFGYDVRTEIFGSESAVMIGDGRETPLVRLDSSGVWSDHIYWFLERFDAAYVEEIRAFVDCIREDRPVSITGADGRAALAMAYAAEASVAENAPGAMSRFAQQGVSK